MEDLISLSYFNTAARYYIYKLSSSRQTALHRHDYFQLLYVDSGQLQHHSAGKSTLLGCGDAFIIPPGFRHRLQFPNDDSCAYSLAFSVDLFHSGFSRSNIYGFLSHLQQLAREEKEVKLRLVLDQAQQITVKSLLDSLIREQAHCTLPQYSAAASLVAATLYILAQCYYGQENAPARISGRYRLPVADCAAYIDVHYADALTADSLSKRFAISRSALYSLFAQYTGQPLKQYIHGRRIQAAETLLRSAPELSVASIAQQVGYTEVSTFYRNFIKLTGVSPSQYREGYFWKEQT